MAPKLFWITRPSRLILALVPKINIRIQVKNTTPCTIMYIFYIMYVIVFNCCRVAPLKATRVYVLKGVSLTILYLYILVK